MADGGAGGGRHEVVVDGRVIELRPRGALTCAEMAALLDRVARELDRAAGPCAVIRDATALDAIEPGTTAVMARWLARNAPRIACTALVTRRPSFRDLASMFGVLVPHVPQRVVATRAEAHAFAARALRREHG